MFNLRILLYCEKLGGVAKGFVSTGLHQHSPTHVIITIFPGDNGQGNSQTYIPLSIF